MKKALAQLLITALGLALLAYSAARSIDFVSMTLPADKQILAFVAVAATEAGILFWLGSFLYGAQGGYQRATALLLLVIDFLGSVALFTADTLFRSGQQGITATLTPEAIQTVIIGLSAIIAANVGATIVYHVFDPKARKERASQEAQDQIEELAIQKITENANSLAAELAPQIATDWVKSTRARYKAALTQPIDVKARPVPSTVSYNTEVISPNLQPAPVRRNGSLPAHDAENDTQVL